MTAFVVDTNVAKVANCAADIDVDDVCKLTCMESLERLVRQGVIAIDETGFVLEEYSNNLAWSGAPGVGDAFFRYILNNQYKCERIKRVAVTPSDDNRGFEELPENTLDRSDRKFLAVAVAGNATILNATDSDWCEQQKLIKELGVDVNELCPHELRQNRGRRRQLA